MNKKNNETNHKRIVLDIDLTVRILPLLRMVSGMRGRYDLPIDLLRDIKFRKKRDRKKNILKPDDPNFDDSTPMTSGLSTEDSL